MRLLVFAAGLALATAVRQMDDREFQAILTGARASGFLQREGPNWRIFGHPQAGPQHCDPAYECAFEATVGSAVYVLRCWSRVVVVVGGRDGGPWKGGGRGRRLPAPSFVPHSNPPPPCAVRCVGVSWWCLCRVSVFDFSGLCSPTDYFVTDSQNHTFFFNSACRGRDSRRIDRRG